MLKKNTATTHIILASCSSLLDIPGSLCRPCVNPETTHIDPRIASSKSWAGAGESKGAGLSKRATTRALFGAWSSCSSMPCIRWGKGLMLYVLVLCFTFVEGLWRAHLRGGCKGFKGREAWIPGSRACDEDHGLQIWPWCVFLGSQR